ncbi:hypothetical protein IU479_23655 [Nocardia abscessus]|uniref:hypothetical protein n=1 Tax=Nocardia abscessus TaxID=120957 RepID=UPI001895F4BF|nr:hypothetical protein [Nocardia abscessus]MBF6221102.1 hypothetical protein [Nocardia abscessus]
MTPVDFTVTHLWDLPHRGGLLVTGRLTSGTIGPGDILQDSASGETVRILGLEFHGSREPEEFTLVIDRRDTDHVRIGQRLINPTTTTTPGTENR